MPRLIFEQPYTVVNTMKNDQSVVDAEFEEVKDKKKSKNLNFIAWAIAILAILAIVAIGGRSVINNSNENKQSQQQQFEAEFAKLKSDAEAAKVAKEAEAEELKKAKEEAEEAKRQVEALKAEQAEKALQAAEEVRKAELDEKSEIALLREELENLKRTPAPAVVATPVVSNTTTSSKFAPSVTNDGGVPIRIGVDQWEDSITERHDEIFVTIKTVEDFRTMYKGMSQEEQHPDFGPVSYVLLRSKEDPDGDFYHGDRPPLAVPAGYVDFREDKTGRWMAVKNKK